MLPGCPDVPHRYANIPPSHHLTDGWHRGVVCVVFVCRENTVSAGCVPFSVIYLINFSIQHVPTILQSSFKTHQNTFIIYKYICILIKRQSIPFFSVLLSYEARFLSLTESTASPQQMIIRISISFSWLWSTLAPPTTLL